MLRLIAVFTHLSSRQRLLSADWMFLGGGALSRQRFCSNPTMFGDVDHHGVGTFILLFEKAGCRRLRTAEAIFGACFFEFATRLVRIFDPKAKVVQAENRTQTVVPIRCFFGFETEHRHVDSAVAQIDSLGDRRIGSSYFDHVKRPLVKLRGLLRIRSVQRYMSQLRHNISFPNVLAFIHRAEVSGLTNAKPTLALKLLRIKDNGQPARKRRSELDFQHNELPRSKLRGYHKKLTLFQVVTPECIYRGSSPNIPW